MISTTTCSGPSSGRRATVRAPWSTRWKGMASRPSPDMADLAPGDVESAASSSAVRERGRPEEGAKEGGGRCVELDRSVAGRCPVDSGSASPHIGPGSRSCRLRRQPAPRTGPPPRPPSGTLSIGESGGAGAAARRPERGRAAGALGRGRAPQGAMQDRVLNVSVLVAASPTQRSPVSCVEQGRWHYAGARRDSSPGATSPTRRCARSRPSRSRPVDGRGRHRRTRARSGRRSRASTRSCRQLADGRDARRLRAARSDLERTRLASGAAARADGRGRDRRRPGGGVRRVRQGRDARRLWPGSSVGTRWRRSAPRSVGRATTVAASEFWGELTHPDDEATRARCRRARDRGRPHSAGLRRQRAHVGRLGRARRRVPARARRWPRRLAGDPYPARGGSSARAYGRATGGPPGSTTTAVRTEGAIDERRARGPDPAHHRQRADGADRRRGRPGGGARRDRPRLRATCARRADEHRCARAA